MEPTTRRHQRGAGERATIEDVAAGAGVSVATVSRALRGLPNVAVSTRQRVSAVAESLHYQPNPAAARLAAGRTRTVTIAVPSLSGWYFSTVVAGAEAVCAEAGYDVLVAGVGGPAELARLVALDHQLERRTDGLVMIDIPLSDELAAELDARGVSVATVGSRTRGNPSVCIDELEVGSLAAEHLVGLGHRRIGFIGGAPDDPMDFEVPRVRRRGFIDRVAELGAPVEPELEVAGNFSIDGGCEAMAELLDHPDPPSAVFAMSDEMAFGALMELRARALRPGLDVSVMGVDDHECSRVLGLTTIRQPVAEHGAVVARMLLDRIDDPSSDPPAYVSPVELVPRTTTGPR